jgi:hypothetical protein
MHLLQSAVHKAYGLRRDGKPTVFWLARPLVFFDREALADGLGQIVALHSLC